MHILSRQQDGAKALELPVLEDRPECRLRFTRLSEPNRFRSKSSRLEDLDRAPQPP